MTEQTVESYIENDSEPKNVHPFIRFLAKVIDIFVGSLLIEIIFLFLYPSIFENKLLVSIIFLILLIPVDALLLNKFGTTLGKYLFSIEISRNGVRLEYSTALKRTFHLWYAGMGCGIPFIGIFTGIISYGTVEKTGETVWDKKLGIKLSQGKFKIIKIIFSILIITASVIIKVI